MLSINYSQLKSVYQEHMDSLFDNLGKNILLIYEDTVSAMPTNTSDKIRGIAKKPKFKSNQPTITENTETITGLIQWNPTNLEKYGINVVKDKNIVRVKTYLSLVPKLQKANYIIPNYDSKNIINKKFKLLKGPVPIGFQEDRYMISFWEEI